jgi:glycosyltransferase involved in cell wall biosynthesis
MDKILIAHIMGQGEIGGMERNLYFLIREHMKDTDLRVGVIFGEEKGYYYSRIKELGCTSKVVNLRRGIDLSKTLVIARYLRNFDIHHFHNSAIPFIIGSIMSGDKQRVLTCRGGYHKLSSVKRFREFLMALTLHLFFNAFTGNTIHAAKIASRLYGIPFGNFKITYNGLDYTHIKPETERLQLREKMGINHCTVLGSTAKFKKWKLLDVLIKLIKQLESYKCRLILVGDGPKKNKLLNLSIELGVGDNKYVG